MEKGDKWKRGRRNCGKCIERGRIDGKEKES